MTKTTSAIMMKYMICEMKSPYRNTDGFPETGEVTVAFSDDRFPVGRTRPTIGLMMSLTSELTTADDATPMTKPIASPMTPNVCRKSTNSLTKPFFFSEAFSILSHDGAFGAPALITATNISHISKLQGHTVVGEVEVPSVCT